MTKAICARIGLQVRAKYTHSHVYTKYFLLRDARITNPLLQKMVSAYWAFPLSDKPLPATLRRLEGEPIQEALVLLYVLVLRLLVADEYFKDMNAPKSRHAAHKAHDDQPAVHSQSKLLHFTPLFNFLLCTKRSDLERFFWEAM